MPDGRRISRIRRRACAPASVDQGRCRTFPDLHTATQADCGPKKEHPGTCRLSLLMRPFCPLWPPAETARGKGRGRLSRVARDTSSGKESDVAGKKRPKSLAQTEKNAPAKSKRPKKTSRGK
jgi:hypothetical protein